MVGPRMRSANRRVTASTRPQVTVVVGRTDRRDRHRSDRGDELWSWPMMSGLEMGARISMKPPGSLGTWPRLSARRTGRQILAVTMTSTFLPTLTGKRPAERHPRDLVSIRGHLSLPSTRPTAIMPGVRNSSPATGPVWCASEEACRGANGAVHQAARLIWKAVADNRHSLAAVCGCCPGGSGHSSTRWAMDGGLPPARIQPVRAAATGTPRTVMARYRSGARLKVARSLRCPAASAK
jgi:hypothetical protein